MENNNTTQTHVTQKLFTEMLRPQTLDQAIIVPRIREVLQHGLTTNILLSGSAGAGKTSLTRILTRGYQVLEINASLENGIDTIRDKVIAFASQSSLFDGEEKLKVVVLEECDGLSPEAWKALRATIEKYHKTVRFIANCNYIDKVPDPIQSRFNVIIIDPLTKEEEEYLFKGYLERIKYILTKFNIQYTDETVTSFVRSSFPDMRSLLNKIQNLYTRGAKELSADMLSNTYDCSDLFKLIIDKPDPVNNYKKLVADWSTRADDAVLAIGKDFPDFILTTCPQFGNKLPLILIATAEYNSMLATSIDKFVTLLGLVFKLQIILHQ